MTALFCFIGTLSGNGGNCGVTSSRSRSFDVSSLIGLSPNDNSRQQRSGSCSPPTPGGTGAPDGSASRTDRPAVVSAGRMAPHSSAPHPSPNVSVGPPAPPPPTAAAGAAGVAAAHAAAVAAMSAAYAGAGAGAGAGGAAPPGAPSGLHPFLLHPGLYQHLITGNVPFFAKTCFPIIV